MNPRVLIVLLVIVVALGAAAFFANQSGPGGAAATGTVVPTATLLLGTDRPVQRVTVTQLGKRVQIHKEGDRWVLDEPPAPEADQTRAASVASQLGRLRPARTLPPGGDLAAFGLAVPETEVQIAHEDGPQETLLIGNQDPTQSGYYARLADKDTVYLIDTGTVSELRRLATDPPIPTPTATPTIVGPVLPASPAPSGTGTPGPAATPSGTASP